MKKPGKRVLDEFRHKRIVMSVGFLYNGGQDTIQWHDGLGTWLDAEKWPGADKVVRKGSNDYKKVRIVAEIIQDLT